jgi:NADPH:quinone reductase
MKAAWYTQTGLATEVLQHGELPDPEAAPGEVRVRVLLSGINPSDVKTRAGSRGPLQFPFQVPHSDGAGSIDRVGPGVSPSRIGERVYVWNAAWNRQMGSCAEFLCLPAEQAVALPDNTDFTAGACIGIPVMTACHAVFSDGPVSRKAILVTGGAGTVGRYAIQFAKWNGARVAATVSGDEKAAVARAAGADLVINYRTENVIERVQEFTSGLGVDRVVEVEFGGNLATTRQILRTGGVIAAYGSVADRTPKIPFYDLMFKHATLRMLLVYSLSQNERRSVCATIGDAFRDGALSPMIGARFGLEDVVKAHEAVESGSLIGNVLIDLS